jgi:hypothetical protein
MGRGQNFLSACGGCPHKDFGLGQNCRNIPNLKISNFSGKIGTFNYDKPADV